MGGDRTVLAFEEKCMVANVEMPFWLGRPPRPFLAFFGRNCRNAVLAGSVSAAVLGVLRLHRPSTGLFQETQEENEQSHFSVFSSQFGRCLDIWLGFSDRFETNSAV